MPPYMLTGPASIDSLLGVPSCLSAFVIVFPFTLSTMFLATFGGPDGALPTHEVHTLVLEMSLLPLKICCDDTLVTPICIHVPEFWHHLKINGILVNRSSADSSVGVRVGSRRRGDPKLSQRIFKVSSGGGKGSHGDGKSGRRRKRRELAAAEKGGKGEAITGGVHERRSAALEEKTAQRHRRTIARSGSATRGVVGVRCRGRREPAELWWTSTMIVDEDDDGGGEDCAVAATDIRRMNILGTTVGGLEASRPNPSSDMTLQSFAKLGNLKLSDPQCWGKDKLCNVYRLVNLLLPKPQHWGKDKLLPIVYLDISVATSSDSKCIGITWMIDGRKGFIELLIYFAHPLLSPRYFSCCSGQRKGQGPSIEALFLFARLRLTRSLPDIIG
ncbi:hypothetical protein Syun_015399 [Stephania yunnanensis]|uniref:Uncharacterized protein n=1 Tax=Stephania yunnanensis TaxID=152371 RepID=A0AAP0JLL7_9MAGN